jgi:nitrite reductase (NO-forming)
VSHVRTKNRALPLLRDAPILLWLVCAAIVTVTQPDFIASRWLVVHVIALGALTHAILVWSQHFVGVLLKATQGASQTGQYWRLGLLQLGVIGVLLSYPLRMRTVTLISAVLVLLVLVWHTCSLTKQVTHATQTRMSSTAYYYLVAAGFLLFGVVLGVLLSRGAGEPWHARLRVAHTLINLLGWVGLTVLGTLLSFWPMILRTKIVASTKRLSQVALPFLATGLVVMSVSPLLNVPIATVGGAGLYIIGIALISVSLWQAALAHSPRSFAGYSIPFALIWLTTGLITITVRVLRHAGEAELWPGLSNTYGTLTRMFLVGFALQVLLGSLSSLLPLAVGGGPSVARPGLLVFNRGATWRVAALNIALAISFLPLPAAIRGSVWCVALIALSATLVLLIVGVFTMIRAKRKRQRTGVARVDFRTKDRRDRKIAGETELSIKQIAGAIIAVLVATAVGVLVDLSL